jgi:hypothetical protein
MILTERDTDQGLLVTVCDQDILGETFEDGEVSLTVTEEFYGGEIVETETVIETLGRASVANIVGTDAVTLAIEEGFVNEERVLEIDGTQHAQFLRY